MWSECAVYRTNRAPMENASWARRASAFTSSEATHPIMPPVWLIDPDIINPYMGCVHRRGYVKCLTCWHILFDKSDISGWRMHRWNLGRLFMYSNSLLTVRTADFLFENIHSFNFIFNIQTKIRLWLNYIRFEILKIYFFFYIISWKSIKKKSNIELERHKYLKFLSK